MSEEENVQETEPSIQEPTDVGNQDGASQEAAVTETKVNLDDFEDFRKYKSTRDKAEAELRNEVKNLRDMVEALQAGKEYDTSKFQELQQRLAEQDALEEAKTQMVRSYGHWPGFDASIFSNCRSVQEVNDVVYAWLQAQVTKSQKDDEGTEEKKNVASTGVDLTPPSEPVQTSVDNLKEKMQNWKKIARERGPGRKNVLIEYLLETEPLRKKETRGGSTSKV